MKLNLRHAVILCFLGVGLLAIWSRLNGPMAGRKPLVELLTESAPHGTMPVEGIPRTEPRGPTPTLISASKQFAVAQEGPPEEADALLVWVRDNPEQALAWMLNAPAGDQRDAVAELVCPHVASSDPARAVILAETFASVTSVLPENLVHQWAEQDATAAYAYATNKPAGDPRDRLLSRVAFVLSKENPARAAEIVAEEMFPGGLQEEAAISVVNQWALQDVNAATTWAEKFPPGALRNRAIQEVQSVTRVQTSTPPDLIGGAL